MNFCLTGLAGAGKTYSAVIDFILPALKENRIVFHNIDGFADNELKLGRIFNLINKNVESLVRRIDNPLKIHAKLIENPGCMLVVDEAQNYFSTYDRGEGTREFFEFLTEARHHNVDVVLITQNVDNITATMRRLIHVTRKFKKGLAFGLKSHYYYRAYEGCTVTEKNASSKVIWKKYDGKIFGVYDSTAIEFAEHIPKGLFQVPVATLSVFALIIFVAGYLGFNMWSNWEEKKPKFLAAKVENPPLNIENKKIESPRAILRDDLKPANTIATPELVSFPLRRMKLNGKNYTFDQFRNLYEFDQWIETPGYLRFSIAGSNEIVDWNLIRGKNLEKKFLVSNEPEAQEQKKSGSFFGGSLNANT